MTPPVQKAPVVDQIWEIGGMEAFHKAKRTALLFASAALIVSLNANTGNISFAGSGASVALDPVLLWWMLAGASAYYVYGAARELEIVIRRHAPFAIQFADISLNEAFGDFRSRLRRVSGQVEQQSTAPGEDEYWRKITHEMIEKALDRVTELQGQLDGISSRVAVQRRNHLFIWEAGAPATFITACLIVGAPQIAAGLHRLVVFSLPLAVQWFAGVMEGLRTGM